MTEQEIINTEFQRNIDKSNMRVDTIEVKIDAFIRSLEDFKTEMRDRDNQRAAETAALRVEMISRDNQRAAETAALRVEMAETTKKMSEEISGIKTELKEFDKYSRSVTPGIVPNFFLLSFWKRPATDSAGVAKHVQFFCSFLVYSSVLSLRCWTISRPSF